VISGLDILGSGEQAAGAAPPVRAPVLPLRLWGLASGDLYDRYWAARGVQVVRPGAKVEQSGPMLYLLCGPHDVLFFELAPLARELNRFKPRVARLRISDDRQQQYTETVVADGDDRFVAIRRHYRSTVHTAARAWLTPDRSIAERWATAPGTAEGSRRVKAAAGQRLISLTCPGQVFDPADPQDAAESLQVLQQRWRNPGVGLDGVFEFQPGVWVHERTRIPAGIRIVGAVWIGASARLPSGEVVVGPAVLGDAPGASPKPAPIDWDAARLSHYRIVPRIRRGRIDLAFKRGFDIAFSLAVLLATAPLYPLIVLAIWLEDGAPFFFAHTRQTLGGRSFPCYKFRTMCRNAEHLKAQLAASNVCDGPQFFIQNDPRVLRCGRIFRKFQLDELPQFWNVLLGHMSVVGPRPSPDKENQFCPTWREARLSVRPGVTGLWQVRRTRVPETDFQEWIRYDLEYVQNASWRLDIWIILQTVRRMLRGD
jgi:lipopolysaccharide/colanic/teichoic acid biosynthesis glycosyltransferase